MKARILSLLLPVLFVACSGGGDGGNTVPSTPSTPLTPSISVTGVSVSPALGNISVGETLPLTAEVTPSDANQQVTWTTSDASVATVNASGVITALAPGTVTITVTTEDGGKTATCQVTVSSNGGTPPVPPPPCSTFNSPITTGTLFADATGISGIAASRDQPGVLWIHSDRKKILYAVDNAGQLLGQWEVSTGSPYFYIYNWEDISVQSVEGSPDRIWIGDIGNNYVRGGGDPRTSIKIMSITEPTIDTGQVTGAKVQVVDNLEFTYPDGLHDAEAMAIDPLTGDLYVFAKEEAAPSKVFRAKAPLQSGVLEEIATINSYWLNGADFSPSGRELLVRNYTVALYWALPAGKPWAEVLGSPPNKEIRLKWTDGFFGEAIGFSADESGFYTVCEQEDEATSSPVEFYAKSCK